jgi:hypothetical protein
MDEAGSFLPEITQLGPRTMTGCRSPLGPVLVVGLVVAAPLARLEADDSVLSSKAPEAWAIEVGSGTTFSNVRDPSLSGYTLVPVAMSLHRRLDRPCFERFAGGVFRASPEVLFGGRWTTVEHGVESWLAQFDAGMRHTFGRPGQRLMPFAEATVGLAWADADPHLVAGRLQGLGQDLNFTFSTAVGLRLDLTSRCYAALSVRFSHYSNAGLSEPEHSNKAIDALGPMLAVGCRF